MMNTQISMNKRILKNTKISKVFTIITMFSFLLIWSSCAELASSRGSMEGSKEAKDVISLDGTYSIIIETPNGTKTDKFVLKTDGDTGSGTFISKEMGEIPFREVLICGHSVQWVLIVTDLNDMRLEFKVFIDENDKDHPMVGVLCNVDTPPFPVHGERIL
ncbi:hypothetical protein OAC89_01030 [Deltaproteobacteria bacterium]|nr:hypothetical protein [Deltaproteobacteria bacterium]